MRETATHTNTQSPLFNAAAFFIVKLKQRWRGCWRQGYIVFTAGRNRARARGRERDWGNWCFRVVILSVVPRILQQGPGSYIIPPLSHTHTHSYSLLWQNTLLLSNIVQHRAALPAFINRAMQAQRSLDSAASRTAEALRELVGRLVVLASWEWLTFRCASENETNRNKHLLGGQIENIFKFFQKMKICNLLGIEMQVN